jgi:hypothetical protein
MWVIVWCGSWPTSSRNRLVGINHHESDLSFGGLTLAHVCATPN